MYHGEDLAKAQAGVSAARTGAIAGPADFASLQQVRGLSVRQTTVPGLVSQAIETANYARDRLESLEALSSRALNLATRLTGPGSAPTSGAERGGQATNEKERAPAAALEALGFCIGDIRRPLAAMDDPFQRLVAALNAIEEALG